PSLPTLVPYTTLFRSRAAGAAERGDGRVAEVGERAGGAVHRRQRDEWERLVDGDRLRAGGTSVAGRVGLRNRDGVDAVARERSRSEEHTSELQSPDHL